MTGGQDHRSGEAGQPGDIIRVTAGCGLDWTGPRHAWDTWFSDRHARAHNKGRDGLPATCAGPAVTVVEPGPAPAQHPEAGPSVAPGGGPAGIGRQHLAGVANAAEHGDGTPIGLALHRHAEPGQEPGITCEVTDGSPAMPVRAEPGTDAERGRGLAIVDALATASGVRAEAAGKTTWFTLALTDRAHRVARQIQAGAEHEPEAGT